MKRTDARVRYTQRVLKEALLSLLAEKPINKITVKEVCALAELNRATFYAHYSDCFALLESIENELVDAFARSLRLVNALDVSALIEAIYDIIEQNRAACRALIFQSVHSSALQRMIELARPESIAYWKTQLRRATDEELEMLYTHLSNGLMNLVVTGYDRYSRETVVRFVNRIVQSTLASFR